MVLAKNKVVEFVGKRMIDEVPDEMPGVLLKEPLTEEDKNTLMEMVLPNGENGTLVFIEYEENSESSDKPYIDTKAF